MFWWKELYDFMDSERELWYPEDEMEKLTKLETDFIEEVFNLRESSSILDLGCGRGRHCIELAKRNFRVTGVDVSKDLIDKAKKNATEQGVEIEFISRDMREIDFFEKFDAVVLMDVSFGIFDEEDNEDIIANIFRALKKDGQALFHLFNPYWWATHPHCRHWGDEDGEIIREYRFDPEEGRIKDIQIYINVNKKERKALPVQSLRAYTTPEMRKMCRNAGFSTYVLYGDRGDFVPTADVPFDAHRSMGMFFKIRK